MYNIQSDTKYQTRCSDSICVKKSILTLKTEAASFLRFQEDSLGGAARRVLVHVIAIVIVHCRSVAFLCKLLLHACDETLVPGEEEEETSARKRESSHDSNQATSGKIPMKLESPLFEISFSQFIINN